MSGNAETSVSRADADALADALRRDPVNPKLLFQFAMTCGRLGECELEASVLGELVTRGPEHPLLLAYYAQALDETDRLRESARFYERSLAIDPTAPAVRATYGMAVLRAGDLARGWELYESRELMNNVVANLPPGHNKPRYTGGNLHGRTIVAIGEQGLGDTIMFARYAPLLAKRGARVVVIAHDSAAELIATVPGVWRVVRFGQPLPPFHTWTRLLSLPRIFATTLANVPHDVPYLRAPAPRLFPWRERLLGADGAAARSIRRVGLVWAGNPQHLRDTHRSIHLRDLAPLADVPGVQFYSVQKGSRQEEAAAPPNGMRLIDLGPQINDIADLAAVTQLLDLVITVDTGPAHLAGALGRPVWTLLSFAPDWRWLLDRDDSPWYPTMRLFRQPALRDWNTPIEKMRDALVQWATTPTNQGT